MNGVTIVAVVGMICATAIIITVLIYGDTEGRKK